jgi:hypothetical protein
MNAGPAKRRTPPKRSLFVAAKRRQLAIVGSSLVGASLLAAYSDTTERILNHVSTAAVAGAITLGPLFGWWVAVSRGDVSRALGLLVSLTLACGIPLLVWQVRPWPWLLVLAAFLWFISGCYFAVGMWI